MLGLFCFPARKHNVCHITYYAFCFVLHWKFWRSSAWGFGRCSGGKFYRRVPGTALPIHLFKHLL